MKNSGSSPLETSDVQSVVWLQRSILAYVSLQLEPLAYVAPQLCLCVLHGSKDRSFWSLGSIDSHCSALSCLDSCVSFIFSLCTFLFLASKTKCSKLCVWFCFVLFYSAFIKLDFLKDIYIHYCWKFKFSFPVKFSFRGTPLFCKSFVERND